MKKTVLLITILIGSTAGFYLPAQQLAANRVESGNAIYYADYLDGQPTSMGEIYFRNELTCAHRNYPKGTLLRITRPDNQRSVTVRVNDGEIHSSDCLIMVSKAAAAMLDMIKTGKAIVHVEAVGYATTNPASPFARQEAPAPAQVARTTSDLQAKGVTENPIPVSYSTNNYTIKSPAPATPAANSYQVKRFLPNQSGYIIQLASYTEIANAERQTVALQQQGISNLYIKEDQKSTGGIIYRLVIGPFAGFGSAQQYLDNLKSQYLVDGIVTKLK